MTEPSGQSDIAGVLLAAGEGTRFDGGNKLLAEVERDGERAAVVRLAAERLLDAPVTEAVAVLGHDAARVGDALTPLPIETVRNRDYASGQATSVCQGVSWARARNVDAAMFALGDMPWVAPSTYRALVDNWRATDAGMVVPTFEGRRGNPVIFGARHFDELSRVTGDSGGRDLLEKQPVEWVPVEDPGIRRDVDTRDDLA